MMEWTETIRTAIAALNARRMRSLLTMLGILIGIAAVMLTVGLGQGAQQQITDADQLARLEPDHRHPEPVHQFAAASAAAAARRPPSPPRTRRCSPTRPSHPTSPRSRRRRRPPGSLQSAATTWTSTVVGTVPDWQTVRARTVGSGRFFSHGRGRLRRERRGDRLGDGDRAVRRPARRSGQTISINGQSFTVIGVLAVGRLLARQQRGRHRRGAADHLRVPAVHLEQRQQRLVDLPRPGKDADSLSAAYQQVKTALLASHQVTSDDRRLHGQHPGLAGRDRDIDHRHPDPAARRHRRHLAAGRRHRRDEHHAGVGERARPRDRPAQGTRRDARA